MSQAKAINYAVLIRLLTMSIVWMLLMIWFLNAYRAPCAIALLIYLLLTASIALASIERALFYRRALSNECLHRGGRLFHLFHNRILLVLRALLSALLLALVLMVAVLLFEPRQWSLFYADLLFLTLLIPRLASAMGTEIRNEYRYAMSRHWSLWTSVLLLWGEALSVLLFSPPENFIGMRWQEVLTYGIDRPEVVCPLLQVAASVYAAGQALAIWSVQNAARLINDPTQSVMVWIGLAALVGLTYLLALAYSQALVGVMGRPWTLWQARDPAGGDAEASDSGPAELP